MSLVEIKLEMMIVVSEASSIATFCRRARSISEPGQGQVKQNSSQARHVQRRYGMDHIYT